MAYGSLQSLDWNGGMEWWNGIVECVLPGERSLLMQFFIMVTPVEVCNHGPGYTNKCMKAC